MTPRTAHQLTRRRAPALAACACMAPATADAIDANANGLDDVWERLHSVPAQSDVHADHDHDGFSLLQESYLGTDPFDFHSALRISLVVDSANGLVHATTPNAQHGKVYQFESALSLDNPQWSPLGDPMAGAAAHLINTSTLPDAPGIAIFYRVRLVGDIDADSDGLTAWSENQLATNDSLADSDGDGLHDAWEVTHSFDPNDPFGDANDNGIPDAREDSDGDGLTNRIELQVGTDPFKTDTDEDSLTDGFEDASGSNPNSVDSDADGTFDPQDDANANGIPDEEESFIFIWLKWTIESEGFANGQWTIKTDTFDWESQPWPEVTGIAYEADYHRGRAEYYFELRAGDNLPREINAMIQRSDASGNKSYEIIKEVVFLKSTLRSADFLPNTSGSFGDNADDTTLLLPIELRDINDHADTGDDVTITPWDTTQPIANRNIAWIDAHTSDQNPAPRMPQLEFRMPGLPQGITIEAKLEVKYERGNGARHPSRTDKDGNTDTVKIPENGDFKTDIAGDTWQIWNEYPLQAEGFFGGDATLTYRLKSGTNEILAPQTIKFRIGGKNPDDARCRDYIETLPDAGPNGSLWFAYAIAKSESRDYNGQGSRYNQFLELPTHVQDVGRPLWGDDGGTLPGGYGMFQVTGNVTDSTANIPRKQIWNWQENCIAGRAIIHHKKFTNDVVNGLPVGAVDWMARQRNANNANGVALPSHTV